MSSLLEIEQAADLLPVEQKKELVAFLLTRLRASADDMPLVRDIPKETIEGWVADDEEGYRKFLAGACGSFSIPASFWHLTSQRWSIARDC